jgi:hypothetical protein
MLILCITLFISVVNIVFLIKKSKYSYYKHLLLYNAAFSFIFSFCIRFFGLLFNDLIGPQLSIYYMKNYAGVDYGFKYDWFNVTLVLSSYDAEKFSGYLFQINLITIAISIVLFVFYLKERNTINGFDYAEGRA